MHKQTLKNLVHFHTNTTFKQFCESIYPDFTQDGSRDYLTGKYQLFKRDIIQFLADLDEKHKEYFAKAVEELCGSDDRKYCDAVDRAEYYISFFKRENLTDEERELMKSNVREFLKIHAYPLWDQLESEWRFKELSIIRELIKQLDLIR